MENQVECTNENIKKAKEDNLLQKLDYFKERGLLEKSPISFVLALHNELDMPFDKMEKIFRNNKKMFFYWPYQRKTTYRF